MCLLGKEEDGKIRIGVFLLTIHIKHIPVQTVCLWDRIPRFVWRASHSHYLSRASVLGLEFGMAEGLGESQRKSSNYDTSTVGRIVVMGVSFSSGIRVLSSKNGMGIGLCMYVA